MNKKTSHNNKIGLYGEDIAVQYLLKKGYKIIARNEKVSYKEIDIVASIKGKDVFVEVKTRTTFALGGAENSLSSKKIKFLKKAIVGYSIKNKLNMANIRMDFIAIDLKGANKQLDIKHYEDIF